MPISKFMIAAIGLFCLPTLFLSYANAAAEMTLVDGIVMFVCWFIIIPIIFIIAIRADNKRNKEWQEFKEYKKQKEIKS